MRQDEHTENADVQPRPDQQVRGEPVDTAGRSLSEALRISFIILKVIMFVLVILFFLSGFKTIGPNEEALVLRFGRIRGLAEERVLGPGLKWVWPYPIEEIIKLPVGRKPNLPVDSMWYWQSETEILAGKKPSYPRPSLDPVRDGYCLTRGDSRTIGSGSDYNIVHSKWQLTYQIDDPERFFKNIYVDLDAIKPGQSYSDVVEESVTELLGDMVESSIVTAMVHYTIDEALSSKDTIALQVQQLMQDRLDAIESGIKVVSVQFTEKAWPLQTDEAFQAFITASQKKQTAISEARTYSINTLNEVGGREAETLFRVLTGQLQLSEEQQESLWSGLAGSAQERIADARVYRTRVVENASANARYLERILPEYRKRPELVLQGIYLDAVQQVLANADEKIIIEPTKSDRPVEIRVLLNRDPLIKKK